MKIEFIFVMCGICVCMAHVYKCLLNQFLEGKNDEKVNVRFY